MGCTGGWTDAPAVDGTAGPRWGGLRYQGRRAVGVVDTAGRGRRCRAGCGAATSGQRLLKARPRSATAWPLSTVLRDPIPDHGSVLELQRDAAGEGDQPAVGELDVVQGFAGLCHRAEGGGLHVSTARCGPSSTRRRCCRARPVHRAKALRLLPASTTATFISRSDSVARCTTRRRCSVRVQCDLQVRAMPSMGSLPARSRLRALMHCAQAPGAMPQRAAPGDASRPSLTGTPETGGTAAPYPPRSSLPSAAMRRRCVRSRGGPAGTRPRHAHAGRPCARSARPLGGDRGETTVRNRLQMMVWKSGAPDGR